MLPNSDGQASEVENISVSINEESEFYIDKQRFPEEELENTLKKMLEGQKEPNIVLNVAKGVPIENAVKVMDIAYRNNFKIVLAVAPK